MSGLPLGIQSPDQMSLLAEHDPSYPVIVEGPFPLWLKKTCVHYYILRAEPAAKKKVGTRCQLKCCPGVGADEGDGNCCLFIVQEEVDPERCFYYPLQLDLDLERDLGDDLSFDVDEGKNDRSFFCSMLSAIVGWGGDG